MRVWWLWRFCGDNQGTIAAREVHKILTKRGIQAEYPLFAGVYDVAFNGADPASIVHLPKAKKSTRMVA